MLSLLVFLAVFFFAWYCAKYVLDEKYILSTKIGNVDELGNGDIIIESSVRDADAIFIASSKFIHASIVKVENGSVFVCEHHAAINGVTTMRKFPIYEFLEEKKAENKLLVLVALNKHPEELIIPDLIPNRVLGALVKSGWQSAHAEENEEYIDIDYVHCQRYVMKALQENGIVSKRYGPSSYLSPQYLKGGIPTINGYKFENPVRIFF